MPRKLLTLLQAADALGMGTGDLRALAMQGDIPSERRGDTLMFFQDEIDLWFSRKIIKGDKVRSDKPERPRPGVRSFPALSALCPPQCVTCALPGSSRASIINALVELADKSTFLFDPKDLRLEITRREEAGSTNIGGGIAIPHTLTREQNIFSENFICLARLKRPVYFNSAQDGSPTELLILSCCMDSEEHLNILGRLSAICRFTNFMQLVRDAESDEELYQALLAAEDSVSKSPRRRR